MGGIPSLGTPPEKISSRGTLCRLKSVFQPEVKVDILTLSKNSLLAISSALGVGVAAGMAVGAGKWVGVAVGAFVAVGPVAGVGLGSASGSRSLLEGVSPES